VLSSRYRCNFSSRFSARSWIATPFVKRRPFDHFQDKWQSLRMRYPAWRKKPLLCRMQFRVTAECAHVSFLQRVCIPCPFTPCRSENSSGQPLIWNFICRSLKVARIFLAVQQSPLYLDRHISKTRRFVLSKYVKSITFLRGYSDLKGRKKSILEIFFNKT